MLRWQDLELDRIDQSDNSPAPVAHIVPKEGWTPKDGESRAIPMHQRLVEILRPYQRTTGWVLHANKPMPKRGGTKRVYRYDPKKIWLRVLKKATANGAKAITPHGMRHSFASNLLMVGVSDVLISRWLGHADTSMVHSHYGHLLSYHRDINRVQIS
jgi:integrase